MLCRLTLGLIALIIVAGCGGGVGTEDLASYGLAFVRDESPGLVGLWRIDTDGLGEKKTCGGVASPRKAAFSPDGSKIAMMLQRDGQYDIAVMSTNGGAIRWLTDDPREDGDPSFDSDGSRIVFYSKRDGHSQIYVMNGDGSSQTRLTNTDGSSDDTSPAFSWDGGQIAFASTRNSESGATHIYIMNADGTDVRQLTSGDQAQDSEPSFSPDGRQIVYVSGSDVYAVKADGTRTIALTQGWGNCHTPSYSPDGWTIMFSSDRRTVDQQVWMMNTDGTGKGRITESGGLFPAWIGGR